MESSSYYKGKVEQFQTLQKQLSGLNSYIDACDTSVRKCKGYLDDIVICNESIDKGVLEDNAAASIGQVSSSVTSLISECNTKIKYYND